MKYHNALMVSIHKKINGMEFYACKSVNNGTIPSQFLKKARDKIHVTLSLD